jgi:predicted DNA-binding transcriptional regulator YafY
MAMRGSEWVSFLRALAILRRLMEGTATNDQLIQSVLQTVGADAYPSAPGAREFAFKRDRSNLKKRLGVDFLYLPDSREYVLNDAGPYGRVSLSAEMLQAVTLLSRQYDNAVGEQAGVRELIQQIIGWLPPEMRIKIEDASEQVSLDFEQNVDRSVIPPRVWETVERALNQHRKLAFHYLSPRRTDRQPVFHELAPYQLRFQDGHWYLRGYDLNNALGGEAFFLRFRLSYIQDDERLRVSPMLVEIRHRRPPRFPVHYLLLPEVGRGEISHRFPETQVTRLADGSAEIQAVTDDVWDAARTLLSYGEACIVLGGPDLRREMERRVKGMAKNYNFYSEEIG